MTDIPTDLTDDHPETHTVYRYADGSTRSYASRRPPEAWPDSIVKSVPMWEAINAIATRVNTIAAAVNELPAGGGSAFGDVASAYVATSEGTTSTSYTDLATTTDTVTVDIGSSGEALVFLSAYMGASASSNLTFMSFAVSGANTIAASDDNSLSMSTAAGGVQGAGNSFLLEDLSSGSTTFKVKYRVSGATGNFARRRIIVIPFP